MRYLGLDLGTKTLGVSLSDKLGIVASFYDNLTYDDVDNLLVLVNEIVIKEKVERIVLGLPKNMNNTCGDRAKDTMLFKEKLEEMTQKEVILEDERLTTKVAQDMLISANLTRKKRKKVIDGVSAVVILQSYLDRKEK